MRSGVCCDVVCAAVCAAVCAVVCAAVCAAVCAVVRAVVSVLWCVCSCEVCVVVVFYFYYIEMMIILLLLYYTKYFNYECLHCTFYDALGFYRDRKKSPVPTLFFSLKLYSLYIRCFHWDCPVLVGLTTAKMSTTNVVLILCSKHVQICK